MSRPTTIIFVPGAWHIPEHYTSITSFFQSKGYPVICEQNPSTGSPDPKTNNKDDALAIRKLIDSVSDDVILIMHSYGGVPGSMAAHGAKNVIGLIFLAAFILPTGVNITDAPAHEAPWRELDFEKMLAKNITPRTTFYHDCDDATAQKAIGKLTTQNLAAFLTPFEAMAWPDLPRMYGIATDDQTLPTFVQEKMVENTPGWLEVKRIDAGHSPWLSKTKETNEWLESAVEKLSKLHGQSNN